MAKHPHDDRRRALIAWLTANGILPEQKLPWDADLTIRTEEDGSKTIVYEACVLDKDGQKQLDDRGEFMALETRTAPLIVDPPDWWQPYEKPTRNQLLDAADRVRKLHVENAHTGDCEYCSVRDYPDYSVPYPCDTVQALDGTAPQVAPTQEGSR